MIPWQKITFLGDTIVLLPAALAIALWLVASRAWRMAALWCILFSFGLTLVAATKIAFIGWGIGIRSLDFTGFSGHAMRAMSVIPVMAYLLLQKSPPALRMPGVCAAFLLGALICLSRVVVHAHSVSEAVAGGALGVIVSGGFLWRATRIPQSSAHRWIMALGMIGLFGTSHAQPAPTQRWINGVALYLSGHDQPYDRATWKLGHRRVQFDMMQQLTTCDDDDPEQ